MLSRVVLLNKRSRANGRIRAAIVGKQRPRAYTSVKAGIGEAQEREYTKC